MTDTGDITIWLGVIAIATVVQVLLLVGGAIAAVVAYRRTIGVIEDMKKQVIAPVALRVNATLDDMQDVISRVKAADHDVRALLTSTGNRAGRAASAVATSLWPALGVGKGVWAAAKMLRRPKNSKGPQRAGSDDESPDIPRRPRVA